MKQEILIIEDDQFLQKAYRLSFNKAGFGVEIEGDGSEAVNSIIKIQPSLILLDIILPGRNGFEILGEVKKNREIQEIPVMIITNLEQKEDVTKGFSLGAIDYIPKSATPIHEIIKKVNLVLK